MRVAVYAVDGGSTFGNKRARYIAEVTRQGLLKHGISAQYYTQFGGQVTADVAVAYGWVHEPVFAAYRAAGARFVYWDLGYWNRRPKGAARDGHHRLAVDDWDTSKTMIRGCPSDRFDALGVPYVDWRDRERGDEILIAGMSEKAARTHGYGFNEWEERVAGVIRRMAPKQKIVLRPKPSKRVKVETTIGQALESARLLVTHHSNAAIDALAAGVPIYCVKGVGSLLSPPNLAGVDLRHPPIAPPEECLALLHDTAYAQWSVPEMRSGDAWDHVRKILCA